MDPSLLLSLVDTSLKVSLGALIAGLAGWLVLRRQANIGPQSGPESRRLLLLEQISSSVGQVTHVFARYAALSAESVQYGERWPETRKRELETVNAELVREFGKLAEAEAQLLMLGEKALERGLRLYGSKIALYRQQVYLGRRDVTKEQVTRLKQEAVTAREHFYDMLSQKYDRLLAKA